MNEKIIKAIYERFGDDLSRKIYAERLMYSLTGDKEYIRNMTCDIKEGKTFFDKLDIAQSQSDIVIFGVGVWGKELYRVTEDYNWKCFVDSNPKSDSFEGLPIASFEDFIKTYNGETVVISSRLHYKEMYEQLIANKIMPEKIINVGYILDELSKKQYFDLEVLSPEKEEVFVDGGSFDGMTSIYFKEWCQRKMKKPGVKVIAFEPDMKNAEKCHFNLMKNNIEHKIIKKGLWSDEKELHFQMESNGSSNVTADGEEVIKVTSMDKAIKEDKVTFIKMDIEGSELEALHGAEQIIKKNKPKLAISIYHKPEDIWVLPEIIMRFNPDYKFYLRHYSLTDYETVLYAVN